MGLRQDLTGQQEQKLALTPDLRQSLAILQLALPELQSLIERELLANCLLELEEDPDGDIEAPEPPAPGVRDNETGVAEDEWPDTESPGVAWDEETGQPTGDLGSTRPSLQEHLRFQLHLAEIDPPLHRAAAYLIGNLDDDGYLRCDLSEAARGLGLTPAILAQALTLVQTFEPPGVGARDLRECLLIQAKALGTGSSGALALALIGDYLGDLAKGRYTHLASALKVSVHEIQAAAGLIRGLDPKPGRNYGRGGESSLPTPDLTIRCVDGEYLVQVREAPDMRLRISPHYQRLLREGAIEDEARRYLRERFRSARWLLRCIERRRITLYKIGDAIARKQRGFLAGGPAFLKPLTLRQIAMEVNLHESTVSRAITGKYVETPHGLVALHAFFPAGVAEGEGEAVSAARVKQLLREAVGAEDPRHPLSDRDLSDLLLRQDCRIARRTVAKYRQELGILPANLRRR